MADRRRAVGSLLGGGALPDVLVSHPDVETPSSPIAHDQVSASVDSPDNVLLISPLVDVGTDSVPDVIRPVAPSPPIETALRAGSAVGAGCCSIASHRDPSTMVAAGPGGPGRARSCRSDLPGRSVHWGLVAPSGIRRTAVRTMTRLRGSLDCRCIIRGSLSGLGSLSGSAVRLPSGDGRRSVGGSSVM